MYIYTYVRMYVCTCVCVYVWLVFVYFFCFVCVCIHMYVCMYVCVGAHDHSTELVGISNDHIQDMESSWCILTILSWYTSTLDVCPLILGSEQDKQGTSLCCPTSSITCCNPSNLRMITKNQWGCASAKGLNSR